MFDFIVGNDALSAIIAFGLVLIPAVLIHEMGHFIAAKMVGITILEFGIGMPPRMIRLFRLGGTDYTLNWLPLGGFVRPLGEDIVRQVGEEATNSDRQEAISRGIRNVRSVGEVPPLARIFFMAGGAIANFIMAFVLLALVGLMGLPQITGARVNILHIAEDSPLANAGLLPFDVVEMIDGEKFTDSTAFIQRIYNSDGQEITLSVLRDTADNVVEVTFTPEIPSEAAASETHPFIRGVAAGSPADRAGIRPGDLVVSFNGENVANFEELQARTRAHLGEMVVLNLWRNGEIVEVSLVPRANPPQGQGAMGIEIGTAAIDFTLGLTYQEGVPQSEILPLSLADSLNFASSRISEVFTTIASIPGQILQGTAQGDQLRLTSPLGISQVGGVYLQESIQQDRPSIIVEFIALISIALGFTNLLPIPALDGGRIVFVLVEIVRGRPIAPEREGLVHLVGLVILLSLMVVVLFNDISNPLTNLLR
ncbi:RIP metalloprotease RseP [Anaerolineae bacterium CFX9]|jgi:regulator of sigma E protease|nr:RIP metalloprotease RseP [Anaerolineae bacterium CFX9]